MNYKSHSRTERQGMRRLFTTIMALCLPIFIATFFSGSFLKLGTLQSGEVLNASSAYAAGQMQMPGMESMSGMQGMAGMQMPAHETEAGTPGSDDTRTPGATGTPQATFTPGGNIVDVQMQRHDVFSPADITIAAGTTVRWTNVDEEQHTTTSDTGVWNSGVLNSGQTFLFTFNVPGTYPYECLIHGAEMRGSVTVTGEAITSTPGATGTVPATSTPAGGLANVSIQNFAFQPQNLTILPGTTVRWTNQDSSTHTTTSDTGLWNSGDLSQGATFDFTFNTPGTYSYHCGRHSGMVGTIIVSAGSSTATAQATSTTQPSETPTPGATGTSEPTGTPAANIADVTIQSYAFSPVTVTVQVGDTVRWTNLDNDRHTVTSVDGLFDSGEFNLNETYSHVFDTAGTYEYFCQVHGRFMTGYVIVEPANACTTSYTDVPPGSTFYDYVQCLSCQGIIGGYADGTFRPGNQVTRGQLSKIVANAAGFTEAAGAQMFEDVQPGSTFYDYVQRLASRGFIGGYSCGAAGEPCGAGSLPYFRPGANATRGQISKIVANAAGYSETPAGHTFEDVAPNSPFYVWIERLAGRSVMGGYSCGGPGELCGASNLPYFRPGANATRGQVSKIVGNTFFPNCNP